MNEVIDRVVQYPHRYQLKNVNTGEILGTFDLEPITGTISVVGTKIDKALFDSIASDISARLVSNGGDAKDNIITYTMPSDRNNIVSGEKLSISFGKIAKYFNDLKAVAFSGNKKDVGLGNVDNTSDMDKPISTAQQQALDLKADKKDVSEVDIDLEGTGTIVSIPENATGYGTIEKLGGKSSVSNLLPITATSTTINGLTITKNDNNSFTVSGTCSKTFEFNLNDYNNNAILPLQNGTYYFKDFTANKMVNGAYANIFENNLITITDDTKLGACYFYFENGKTYNTTYYPKINKGSIELPYEPYGLNIYYPTNFKVVGRNLFDKTKVIKGSFADSDGNIDNSNTHNNISDFINVIPNKEITITNSNGYFFEYDNNKNVIRMIVSNNAILGSNTHYIRFDIPNANIDSAMCNYGDASLSYSPYIEPKVLPQTDIINYVANELQTNHSWNSENASKWLGLGVGNDSNIINYANNKAIVKYSIVDLGTLSWNISTENDSTYYYCIMTNAKANANAISTKYICNNIVYLLLQDNQITFNMNQFSSIQQIVIKTDTTPTGLLIYELATPIEIDLSSLETEEHFECESNGTIIHDNTANYKYSFPVSLKGQVALNFEHDKEQQKQIDKLENNVDELDNKKANKSEIYTKEETDSALSSAKSYTDTKIANLVGTAPETMDTLEEVANAIKEHKDVAEALNSAIGNKVDKVDGKKLSTNDFTNELKNKLDGLSNYDDTSIQNEITNIKNRLDTIEASLVFMDSRDVNGITSTISDGTGYYYNGSFTIDSSYKVVSASFSSKVGANNNSYINYTGNTISYKLYTSSANLTVSATIEYVYKIL